MKHGAAGAALLSAGGAAVPRVRAGRGADHRLQREPAVLGPDGGGPSAVNPTIQGIYKAVFDQYIDQNPDLTFQPGLLTEWGWNEDRTKIVMKVREGATWHDGAPVTPEDVVWSLTRAGDPAGGNPIQFVWGKVGNYQVEGNTITGDVLAFEPTLFKWMAFLTGYILPKAYYEMVGPRVSRRRRSAAALHGRPVRAQRLRPLQGLSGLLGRRAGIRDGDLQVRHRRDQPGRRGGERRLRAHHRDPLRGIRPAKGGRGPDRADHPGVGHRDDLPQRRRADAGRERAAGGASTRSTSRRSSTGCCAATACRSTRCRRRNTTPTTRASSSATTRRRRPSCSPPRGFSPDNPVRFTIQTTRGFKPKDYEIIQAIVGMWRKVGIEAEIEVYEIAKHYELRAMDTLAPAAFYNWGNSIGDPSTSTGFAMFGPSPHSVWDTTTSTR